MKRQCHVNTFMQADNVKVSDHCFKVVEYVNKK